MGEGGGGGENSATKTIYCFLSLRNSRVIISKCKHREHHLNNNPGRKLTQVQATGDEGDLLEMVGVHFKNKPIQSLVLKDGMIFKVGKVKLQYLVTRVV
jgi:hypothetical protein